VDTDKNTDTAGQPVTVGGSSEKRPILIRVATPFKAISKKVWLIIMAAVLVAGIGGYIAYQRADHEEKLPVVKIQSEAEVLSQQIQAIQRSAPSETAPLQEKIKYYDELFKALDSAGDYKAAVAAFEKRQALSVEGLQYHDYFSAGRDYCHLKDKVKAKKAYDDLLTVLPAADDPSIGFVRANLLGIVDAVRQECGV
jgi:tetratricopeptide (TPR) repeat protein